MAFLRRRHRPRAADVPAGATPDRSDENVDVERGFGWERKARTRDVNRRRAGAAIAVRSPATCGHHDRSVVLGATKLLGRTTVELERHELAELSPPTASAPAPSRRRRWGAYERDQRASSCCSGGARRDERSSEDSLAWNGGERDEGGIGSTPPAVVGRDARKIHSPGRGSCSFGGAAKNGHARRHLSLGIGTTWNPAGRRKKKRKTPGASPERGTRRRPRRHAERSTCWHNSSVFGWGSTRTGTRGVAESWTGGGEIGCADDDQGPTRRGACSGGRGALFDEGAGDVASCSEAGVTERGCGSDTWDGPRHRTPRRTQGVTPYTDGSPAARDRSVTLAFGPGPVHGVDTNGRHGAWRWGPVHHTRREKVWTCADGFGDR